MFDFMLSTIEDKISLFAMFTLVEKLTITFPPGNYCEGATPDPISNSEVKSFSANGTLS